MGAVLSDAALQPAMKYTTVKPRVQALIQSWPDAVTTSGFVRRIQADDLAVALRWPGNSPKMRTLRELSDLVSDQGIETVDELRGALRDDGFRTLLAPGAGCGTEDHCLPGCTERLRFRRFGGRAHQAVREELRRRRRFTGAVRRTTQTGRH